MYSIEHSFIFVHIPRTAGNSIQTVLLKYSNNRKVTPGNRDGVHRFEVEADIPITKHSPIRSYMALDEYDGMLKFTCIRNPWERWLSEHHRADKYSSPDEFDRLKFMRNVERRPCMWHYMEGGEFDLVLRFERLQRDWRIMLEMIGLEYVGLPHVNRGNHHHYSEYYDDELVEIVRDKEHALIERFGYEFEGCGRRSS